MLLTMWPDVNYPCSHFAGFRLIDGIQASGIFRATQQSPGVGKARLLDRSSDWIDELCSRIRLMEHIQFIFDSSSAEIGVFASPLRSREFLDGKFG